jgi:hypothetical protein
MNHIPTPKKREILEETVKVFGQQEWFRDAVIYDSHPLTGAPTLEFKVNYVPILGPVRKIVMDFAVKHNLSERFVIVDRDGKPVD